MTTTDGLPLIQELTPAPGVIAALRAVQTLPKVVLFDSALQREPVGRYSFLMADPVQNWQLNRPEFACDPYANLEAESRRWSCESLAGLPPFQGGIAGLMGYELGQCFERIPAPRYDELQIPVLAAGLYDWVLAWDHRTGRAWLISHGWPETDATLQRTRASERMQFVLQRLASHAAGQGERHRSESTSTTNPQQPAVRRPRQLAPQFSLPGAPGLTSTFTRQSYLKAVERVIEYIRAGDIFQANLTQRLQFPSDYDATTLFERLRLVNPAPFAGMLRWDDWAVISASPERFLQVDGHDVETRPIKGTRRRKKGPEADLFTRDELRESEKDQAENVMIVDLLRNDLSRVCEAGSIRVPQLCGVESYETVQHLVSEVRGRLRPGKSVWDLFRATIPGGSITGAPKVRAMEIIAELEPTVRGPYCGSFFYVGANGKSDSNLLIRTFVQRNGWLHCGVGGGIVAQSNPAAEYEETLIKAAGMIKALVNASS